MSLIRNTYSGLLEASDSLWRASWKKPPHHPLEARAGLPRPCSLDGLQSPQRKRSGGPLRVPAHGSKVKGWLCWPTQPERKPSAFCQGHPSSPSTENRACPSLDAWPCLHWFRSHKDFSPEGGDYLQLFFCAANRWLPPSSLVSAPDPPP